MTQAALDEEIENKRVDYSEKIEAINKKIEINRKKSQDERDKIQQEFEENLAVMYLLRTAF